jgi:hypothetical protein
MPIIIIIIIIIIIVVKLTFLTNWSPLEPDSH